MLTREELSALIASAADPDEAPAALASISQGVGELFDHIEEQDAARAADAETMETLRQVNTKLFLQTTGGTPFSEAEEDQDDDYDVVSNKIKEEKGW